MPHGSEVSRLPQVEQVDRRVGDVLQRREQRLQRALAPLHQVQHRAPRRARPEAREPRQRLAQCFDLLTEPCRRQVGNSAAQVRHRAAPCGSSSWAARTSRCRASTRWSRPGTTSSPPTASRRARPGAARPSARPRCTSAPKRSGSRCARRPASRSDEEQARFAALDADLAVVAAYGLILPRPILEAPQGGCINVHASLLPRWRGAAPIQRAILAGDAVSGVTIMRMDEGLDTGPMLLQRELASKARTPGKSRKSLRNWAPTLARMARCTRPRRCPSPRTASLTRQGRQGRGADRLEPSRRAGRAAGARLRPAPGAWFEANGERVKMLEAEAGDSVAAEPGEVLDEQLDHRLRRRSDPPRPGPARRARADEPGRSCCAASPIPAGTILP